MSDQKIRIGFIGLNAKDCWAVNAHLPYLRQSAQYQIVALLNSSEDAAKAAIALMASHLTQKHMARPTNSPRTQMLISLFAASESISTIPS